MSATAVQEVPNTQEMVVIHRIFRRGFAPLADLARRVPAQRHGVGRRGGGTRGVPAQRPAPSPHRPRTSFCGRCCSTAPSRTLCSSPAWRNSTLSSAHT